MSTTIPPAPAVIRAAVIEQTGRHLHEWEVNSRSTSVIFGKRLFSWIAVNKLGMSYQEAASMCFWGSHSSAIGAVREIEEDSEILPGIGMTPSDYAQAIFAKACEAAA